MPFYTYLYGIQLQLEQGYTRENCPLFGHAQAMTFSREFL